MESKCSISGCQGLPEAVCICSNVLLCKSHTIDHFSTPGMHKIEKLTTEAIQESKNFLIQKLIQFSYQIDLTVSSTRKNAEATIQKIYYDLKIVENELMSLKVKCLETIKTINSMRSVYRSSSNYFDIVLQKPISAIADEYNIWRVPTVEFHIKSTESVISILEDCIPFASIPTKEQLSLITSLSKINNKLTLMIFGQELKNQPESLSTLLSLIKSSSKNPDLGNLSSKAFTILSKLHYNFSGMDLSGINIQNSEIVGGKFINTNFQDSNFRQVKLNPSVLPKAIINFKVLESIEQGKSSFSGHSKPITCIKFSPEGHFLVTGSEDRTLRIWEARSGHTLVVLEGHSDIIFAIAISEDSSEIVSGGRDGTVRLWDAVTGNSMQIFTEIQGKGVGLVSSVAITSSKDLVLAGTWESEIIIWNRTGGVYNKFTLMSPVWSLALPANGNEDSSWNILAGTRQGELVLMKTNVDGRFMWVQKEAHRQQICNVAISINSNMLISAGVDGLIKVWVSNKKAGGLGRLYSLNYQSRTPIQAHPGGITGFCVTNSFKSIATVGGDKKIKMWDRKTGKSLGSYEDKDEIKCIGLSQNGNYFAFARSTLNEVEYRETTRLIRLPAN